MASTALDDCIEPFEPIVLRGGVGAPTGSVDRSRLELHVLPFGLTVHRLLLILHASSAEDTRRDLIVGPEDARDHHLRGRNFFGPLVGRYANRLPAGKNTDASGYVSVNLPEWGGSGICHHGGPETLEGDAPQIAWGTVPSQSGPFDRAVWTPLIGTGDRPVLFEPEDEASASPSSPSSVTFAMQSAQGSNGFPGEVRVEARFILLPAAKQTPLASPSDWPTPEQLGHSTGRVHVEYRAKLLSADVSATPLNLTQHWGFNLSSGAEAAQEDVTIDQHTLRVIPHRLTAKRNAPTHLRRLDLDERGVPTGKLLFASAGDVHDWASPAGGWGKKIADQLPDGGYDHFYVWGNDGQSSPEGIGGEGQGETVALLSSPTSGLSLAFSTNQSGVQLYTANGQPSPSSVLAKEAGRYGGVSKLLHRRGFGQQVSNNNDDFDVQRGNLQRSAAFLEFSHPHATLLYPELQRVAGSDTLLRNTGESDPISGRNYGYCNWCQIEVWQRQEKC